VILRNHVINVMCLTKNGLADDQEKPEERYIASNIADKGLEVGYAPALGAGSMELGSRDLRGGNLLRFAPGL
jgi:hypothetical protein